MKANKLNYRHLRRNLIFHISFANRFSWLCAAVLGFAFAATAVASEAGTIKGTVRAIASSIANQAANSQSTTIAGAKLTLVNKATPSQPLLTVSNAVGEFAFNNLPAGNYTLTITANGLTSASKEITLASGALLSVEIDLTATVNETVTVRDEVGLLSTSETTTSNVVRSETLKNQPLRTDNFQNAIQLTPGAIRDGYGNDYLKGTRTGQSGYTVNGADITDPGTGNLAFDIPLEAAQSVQIEENPYSAEFGRFTGGVTNLQTKGGGDKFKVSAARFFPTFHNIFSTQIDSFRPRITFSGPLIAKKLFFLQSFEYRFSRTFVPSQPKPDNNIVQEGFNSFTQIDWNINLRNSFRFNAAVFPAKFRNLGLNIFNPAATTPNYKQRGVLFSATEQAVFKDSSFLSSEINYKTFDVDVFPKSNLPFSSAPATNSGGYFADTRRQTRRIQWQEVYFSRPLKFYGDHSIKTGFAFAHTNTRANFRFNPISIRRIDDTLAQQVDFVNPTAPVLSTYNEFGFFAQDHVVVGPKVTLEYGIRFDRDSITKRTNISPRFSFLFAPFKGQKTLFRGGAGVFYDKTLASAGYFSDPSTNFSQYPDRIVTSFGPDGVTPLMPPTRFFNQVSGQLKNPRSVRYNFQIDHQFAENLIGRFGFLQRFTTDDLLINPLVTAANAGTLLLSSTGKSRYSELQFIVNYSKPKLFEMTASYVLARSTGDLNTADLFIGDRPSFVVRPNQYSRLPFDAPHRFLLTGLVYAPHDIQIAPLFEVRSGFPFSAVNERLDFVGARNTAGRFPTYMSLDLQVTKGFQIPFIFKDKRARVGVALFNLTNHFNPRDVQMNLTSPNFGAFYNSLGTSVKAKFDIDF